MDASGECFIWTRMYGDYGTLNDQITEEIQAHLNIKDPWLLVHRADLHNALREKAEEGFEGKKPKIHLSCAVESVVRCDLAEKDACKRNH